MNATGILHTGIELINLPCLTGITRKTTEGQVLVDGMRRTMERMSLSLEIVIFRAKEGNPGLVIFRAKEGNPGRLPCDRGVLRPFLYAIHICLD